MSKRYTHNGETFTVGEEVECVVPWPNGRRVHMRGKLITIDIDKDEVFIETSQGPVVGDLETLEKS